MVDGAAQVLLNTHMHTHQKFVPARMAARKKAGSPVTFHRWHAKGLDELARLRVELPCETVYVTQCHGSPWNGPFMTTF